MSIDDVKREFEEGPEPVDEAAFYGLLGEFVRHVSPQSEADPVAILVQGLIFFGNHVGGGPYRLAGGQRHHLNEFAVIVGKTKRGRKGSALAEVERLFELLDPEWLRKNKKSGLASGEGLIWHVRDPIDDQGSGAGGGDHCDDQDQG